MRVLLHIVLAAFVFLVAEGTNVEARDSKSTVLTYRYPDGAVAVYKNRSNIDLNMGMITAQLQTQYMSEEKRLGATEGHQSVEYKMTDLAETVYVAGQLVPREELALLEGQSVRFELGPQGQVSDFSIDELGRLTYAQEQAIKPVLASLRLGIPALYPELPSGPMSVGDSWDSEREFTTEDIEGVAGKSTINASYNVKKARKRKGHLCFEIEEVAATTTNSIISFGQMTVLVSGSGSVKSKIEFDTVSGLILKYESRGKLKVDTKPIGDQNVPPSRATMSIQGKRELKEVREEE